MASVKRGWSLERGVGGVLEENLYFAATLESEGARKEKCNDA
jgi:hypothetical protein